MAQGYLWDPVVRITPKNGADIVYWFSDQLTDFGGHTRISVRYPEVKRDREDINRTLRPVMFGIRPEVDIECAIMTLADQAFLSNIESALLSPADYDVYLSLDGGVTERAVVLNRMSQPAPIGGKTVVGAYFTLQVRCKDLISQKPAMMTDPGVGAELTENGNLDSWASSTNANAWTEVVSGACTVTEETSDVHTAGGNAAILNRVDGGSLWMQETLPQSLKLGAWYHVSCYGKANSAAYSLRVGLRNNTKALDVTGDGKTWGGFTQYAINQTATTSYALAEAYVRASTSFGAADSYILFLYGVDVGSIVKFDDVSVYGPILRPGYATW